MRLRREVVRSPKSAKSSLAAQAVMRRVENERDDALASVHSITVERDTLHERLKVDQLLLVLHYCSHWTDQCDTFCWSVAMVLSDRNIEWICSEVAIDFYCPLILAVCDLQQKWRLFRIVCFSFVLIYFCKIWNTCMKNGLTPNVNLIYWSFGLSVMLVQSTATVCTDCHRDTAGWQSSYGTDNRRPRGCFAVGMYDVIVR